MPNLQAAAVQLLIANVLGEKSKPQPFEGKQADHPIATLESEAGAQVLTAKSHDGTLSRKLWVVRGSACSATKTCFFYYFSDGSDVARFLSNLNLDVRQRLSRAVLVGIEGPPDDDQFGSKRIDELLESEDSAGFPAFESFFVERVIPLVEGKNAHPPARWVGGWSNGGSWALNMALRHPNLFTGALAFSIGTWAPPHRSTGRLRFEVGSGTLEGPFYRSVQSDAGALQRLGGKVEQRYVVGGHSQSTWAALLDWSLERTLN